MPHRKGGRRAYTRARQGVRRELRGERETEDSRDSFLASLSPVGNHTHYPAFEARARRGVVGGATGESMKKKKSVITSKLWCICCGKPWTPSNEYCHKHHRHPKSQNGGDEDTNIELACKDCHELYNVNNMQLAQGTDTASVKARVRNFKLWIANFPDAPVDFFGPKGGLRPWDMAPDFVLEEVGHFMLSVNTEYKDYSNGRLSRLGKVSVYPKRTNMKGA